MYRPETGPPSTPQTASSQGLAKLRMRVRIVVKSARTMPQSTWFLGILTRNGSHQDGGDGVRDFDSAIGQRPWSRNARRTS